MNDYHVLEGIDQKYYQCSCGFCPMNKDRTTNIKKLEKHINDREN